MRWVVITNNHTPSIANRVLIKNTLGLNVNIYHEC